MTSSWRKTTTLTAILLLALSAGDAASAPTWSSAARRPAIKDRGIFADLDPRVRLRLPKWLSHGPWVLARPRGGGPTLVLVDGEAVGYADDALWRATPAAWRVTVSGAGGRDEDGDGIVDALDVLIGAKKTALNAARYDPRYVVLPYPGGDVPREIGVCTDVVIRALRNAGYDLQKLVAQDIRRARRAYRAVKRPNRSIDHRRVRGLLPYFRRHLRALPFDQRGEAHPLLPGDIVLLNTLGDPAPDHLGIISDRLGPSGLPLVINNWTHGHRTTEMDLLSFVPITHRFRLPRAPLGLVDQGQRGLAGLLRRRGIRLGADHRQALVITTGSWPSNGGLLQRYVRSRTGAPWRQVGKPRRVRLGGKGLGWGRGLHGGAKREGPVKREGDHRSPAGLFTLGTAFGTVARPYRGRWPWRRADGRDRFVDDPASPHYNRWRRLPPAGHAEGKRPWTSAEDLSVYRVALVVEHNTRPVLAGAGSAIFVHLMDAKGSPSVGCSTLRRKAMVELLGWLRPAAKPVLIQLPGALLR